MIMVNQISGQGFLLASSVFCERSRAVAFASEPGISPALPLNDPHHLCLPRTLLGRGEFSESTHTSKVEKRFRKLVRSLHD